MVKSLHQGVDLELRSVLYREGNFHLAHCLELDLVGEGATPREALDTLVELVECHVATAIEDGDLASIFRPAPAELWRLYSLGQPRRGRKTKSPVTRFELREWVMN